MPPSLPLQEVHVSKEIIGKISVASKSKPMFFSTLQTLPLRPLCDGPKGNLLASDIFFPSPVFFHTVARVIFPEQRPDKVALLGEKPGKIPVAEFLGPCFKVLLLYDHRLPSQPHRLLYFFLFLSAWHSLHVLKPCPPACRDSLVTFPPSLVKSPLLVATG